MTSQSASFPNPLAKILCLNHLDSHCANCFQLAAGGSGVTLKRCSRCRKFQYCSEKCQKSDWPEHKAECKIIAKHPGAALPPKELFFFARLCEVLATKRGKQAVTHITKGNKTLYRDWESLETHQDDIFEDPSRKPYFEAIYDGLGSILGAKTPSEQDMREIFGKKIINSHGISDNRGFPIGEAIDLGISAYDHSCWPNIAVVYEGSKLIFRSLDQSAEINDTSQCFLSYVELASPRAVRQKELLQKYYFKCACERCVNYTDKELTAIKCSNADCTSGNVIDDFYELNDRARFTELFPEVCSSCGTPLTKDFKSNFLAQALPALDFLKDHECSKTNSSVSLDQIDDHIQNCRGLLNLRNIVLLDLCCLYLQQSLIQQRQLSRAVDHAKSVIPTLGICYPPYYKALSFHILKIAYAMVLEKKYVDAIPFVEQGLAGFERFFGFKHPYTRQINDLNMKIKSKVTEENHTAICDLFQFR